ncbi:MAG: glutamine amidotransferase [Polyangiaceae bacterium]
MTRTLAPAADLSVGALVGTAVVFGLGVALLLYEVRRARSPVAVVASGVLAALALACAVLRPVALEVDGVTVGPRVVVLVDGSRSMRLPGSSGDRARTARDVVQALRSHAKDARIGVFTFGVGPARPVGASAAEEISTLDDPREPRSDLFAAIESIAKGAEEPPAVIVVVSDGRLDRPLPEHADSSNGLGLGALDARVHTVATATRAPKDASIRKVEVAGAAVAHQPFSIRVEVGCAGGLSCGKLPVVVNELVDDGPALELARGEADVSSDGAATIELGVTLHRAGQRVIEVRAATPEGDAIAENDHRFVTIDVARDRVRVLHIAGRPTYDVRALRTWLKSDESVDVVAFFILRTPTDGVNASPSELALIPFPVDELFTEHLPSFDAVVLQDFNAAVYGLTKHLGNLAEYIKKGGGLIMVGGPDAFGPGMYAGTPIADALPVQLTKQRKDGVDLAPFSPELTPAGRVAPVLGPMRDILGDAFPDMPGTDIVGRANKGATVLFTHPTLTTDGSEHMPVLALGEHGTGRVIALTVDGTHRLLFGSFAAETAGRAYGALWDGLLGWLMRDPRFESTSLDLPGGCVSGEPSRLVVRPLPGPAGDVTVEIRQLGSGANVFDASQPITGDGGELTFDLPAFDPGGYSAEVRIGASGGGDMSLAPATRRDFACEAGGDEWADSRPDVARLETIAKTTRGKYVDASSVSDLPIPTATLISTQRKTRPLLPPWGWTSIAAVAVGVHWVLRRRRGLS